MFVLLVELKAQSGKSDALEHLLNSLVALAEHEPGIVFYAVHRPQKTAEIFWLYEYYANEAAWKTHQNFPPVQEKLKCFDSLLAAPPRLIPCTLISATPFQMCGGTD